MSGLPSGWITIPAGDVGVWRGGGTPSKANSAFWTYGTIPWVSPKDMKRQHIAEAIDNITSAAIDNSATQLIPAGSVLVVTRSGILQHSLPVAANTVPVAINQDLKAVTPFEGIEAEFVLRQLQADAADILKDCAKSGTTVDSLDFDRLRRHDFRLPPLAEQRRIVAKVDGLTARTARARKELDRIPTLVARYKQRLLALAYSGELTAGWRADHSSASPVEGRRAKEIRSKFADIGSSEFRPPFETPESWRWLRLPELGDLDRGKSRHRPRNDPTLFGGPYPFVQTGDVRAAERYLTEFTTTYSEVGLEQSRLWPVGTVCITIAANIAETAILGIEACFPDSVVGFVPDQSRASAAYVEFFIRTMRADLESFAPATAQKNINLNVLSNVRVPVPPFDEQAEIVRRIESAFGWLDRVAADHAAAARRLPKLDAAILAKAFRGELVPQDPNDEPASVLLERVRASQSDTVKQRRNQRRLRPHLTAEAERELAALSEAMGPTTTDRIREKIRKGAAVTKSRKDDDVMGKPYLAGKLKRLRSESAQDLFRAADLNVADFYKQLAWEIERGHIVDDAEQLRAA